MEELLLCLLLTGDELDIVHQQQILAAVFITEISGGAAADGINELVGEVLAADQHNVTVGPQAFGLTGDGVEQMCLAQATVSVDEEGVELACRLF